MTFVVRPTVLPPAVWVPLFAILLSAPAHAQSPVPIATHVGTEQSERLGLTTAIVGDLDRDGCADYLIGAPGSSPGGVSFAGSAFLYSGASGAVLRQIDGTQAAEQRGFVAALGDLDGDSIPDYAVAAPLVPNGATPLAGSIWVVSGKTHQTLYDLRGPTERAKFGTVMTGIGDADGDGLADMAIGSWPIDLNGLVEVGVVYVVRGVDGALIRSFNGQFEGQRFG
ncbi:MAG TPA: integrin alpha, partial [Candidatus Eisenbacteria bacterium]|nr:integrin alpha [Candidatus Eisenbacteria bacterium]